MTDPFTAAILTTTIAGTAVTAYGQYQEKKSAQQQAKAESAWHAYNAKVAQREEEAERAAVAFESKQQRRKAEQLLARQRVLVGKAGVEMVGSPLLVAEDAAAQLALENINIRQRGIRRQAGFRSQSILDISKASAAKSRAAGYGKATITGAGASILGGAADVGYQGYKMGVWGQ